MSQRSTEGFTEGLLEWYNGAKRDLPWRHTTDPYAIWVSEAMLQQTQVATALPYYARWMERFPDVASLASASEDEALSLWQGLGYYRRCKMLREGAQRVLEAGWPRNCKDWRSMPGVGDYTAAAIASICLNEATAVVDGNVERVFARVMASDLTGGARRKAAQTWASMLLSPNRPADFNQAMMELGATVCRPANPACADCPVQRYCQAYESDAVGRYPVANPKPNRIDLEWPVMVVKSPYHVLLERANDNEWWSGMLKFPRLDDAFGASYIGSVQHTVTRHRVTFLVYSTEVVDHSVVEIPRATSWHALAEMSTLPIPSAMRKVWRLADVKRSQTLF